MEKQGPEIVYTIPARSDLPADPGYNTSSPSSRKPTILLVDDNADSTKTLRLLLERPCVTDHSGTVSAGYIVRTAETAADAIRTVRTTPIDLIISDIALPDESGLDMLPKLRAIFDERGTNGSLPAIAVSGFAEEEDIRRSYNAGFQEHIAKPLNIPELRETIARLLPPLG